MFRLRSLYLIALLIGVFATGPPSVRAATNSVTAGIGGINNGTLNGGDGTGTGQFTLNTVNLALVKQARDLAGTVLPDGSNVTSGQEIFFVLYVDNLTNYSAGNLQISDLLNETQFTYTLNSIETTVVPTGSTDAAIWAGTWTALSDALGGPDDIASITDTGGPVNPDRLTIGAVGGQVNQGADIPGNSLRAIRFKVTVN